MHPQIQLLAAIHEAQTKFIDTESNSVFRDLLANLLTLTNSEYGFIGEVLYKDDLPYLKPTFWPSVPRLVNVLYDQLKAEINNTPGEKGKLMRKALAEKLARVRKDGTFTHEVYDEQVFSHFRAKAGGRVRMLMTAAAPSAKEVQDFLEVVFCCKYNEAYGLTETSGGDCFAHLDDLMTGHVGGTIAC